MLHIRKVLYKPACRHRKRGFFRCSQKKQQKPSLSAIRFFGNQDNECTQKKDNFNAIIEKLLKADAMILGSPTYFAAVSADLKALIERAGYVAYANGHTFSGKIGAAAVAVRRGGATHVYDTINHMFQMSRMIMPCSTYWNMGYGLNKGEVNEDEEGLSNMRHLGKSIDWLGKLIKPNLDSYPKG